MTVGTMITLIFLSFMLFIIIDSIRVINRPLQQVPSSKVDISEHIDLIKNHLSPREFEIYCAALLNELGYKAKVTQATNDEGRDIVAYNSDGELIFIECKLYKEGNKAGREIIQKLSGSCWEHDADAGIVICTGGFTQNALDSASKMGNMDLWDMDVLKAHLKDLNKGQLDRILLNTIGNFKPVLS